MFRPVEATDLCLPYQTFDESRVPGSFGKLSNRSKAGNVAASTKWHKSQEMQCLKLVWYYASIAMCLCGVLPLHPFRVCASRFDRIGFCIVMSRAHICSSVKASPIKQSEAEGI